LGWVWFWLREGVRDGHAEQVEGSSLGGGGGGEHIDVSVAEADVVAGEGGEVVEQFTEPAHGPVVGVGTAGRLGGRGGRAVGRADRVGTGWWVFVSEGERGEGPAQVPDQVGSEHADQHVRADPVGEAVVDGPQVQVVDLDGAEVALDVGQVLVGGHDVGGGQVVATDVGAQHVDAVEGGFGGDVGLAAGDGQGGVGDGWRAPFLSDRCPTWIADLGGRNRVTQGRRNYTAEYREEAVRLVLDSGRSVAAVARELGVNEGTLGNWVNRYRREHADDEPPLAVNERARLRELEKQSRDLRMENEFLKKAAAFFARKQQ
jgi:transposase